ncbi:ribosome assembly RNA-binding protein YhbY [Halanaerobacter jeridensis]|uniref:RNA-binding protein n=1 Tax=Halanaerobacter jeridensis TaxID=706427 RepID=A0A938XP46_9FIRM|nr:ribosome assembly RNA-binding protein YhbY [Halanaerobacter jeridensis]MBM7556197.1 RNA-binding protein [Halanaerobacter jeridensis]
MTGKQRAYLRGEANSMNPVLQIGKDGITQAVINQVDETISSKELIKIRVLDNSLYGTKEAAHELADALDAEVIQTIGSVIVLFRQDEEDSQYNLPS